MRHHEAIRLHAIALWAAAVAVAGTTLAAELPVASTPTGDNTACTRLMSCGSDDNGSPNASGDGAVAIGQQTIAGSSSAFAMGYGTTASGLMATAMGDSTTASGNVATAMGWNTVANCGGPWPSPGYCTVMGAGINNTQPEALVNSGDIHGRNINLFGADARLAQNITDTDPTMLLQNVERLRVVERAPSANDCRHQHRDPDECARDRTVGLISQQVGSVVPDAVGSGASLTLVDAAKADLSSSEKGRHARLPVLEEVDAVLGLDVHALLAQLVGAIQALSAQNRAIAQQLKAVVKQNEALAEENKAIARQNQNLGRRIAVLETAAWR